MPGRIRQQPHQHPFVSLLAGGIVLLFASAIVTARTGIDRRVDARQSPQAEASDRPIDLATLKNAIRRMSVRQQIDYFFPNNHVDRVYEAVHSEKTDHIGVSVRSIDAALATDTGHEWTVTSREMVGTIDIAMLEWDPKIELIAATQPPADATRRMPSGAHHVAVEVHDINGLLRQLDARGIRIRDKTSRPGAMGHQIAFFSPDAFDGVLYELVEVGHSAR
jgi:methylmalonyl-CoA/ethylmalonyl-CoA epimerase